MNNGIKYITREYILNDYNNLIKYYHNINDDKTKLSHFITFFIIILLGNKECIGICFAKLIELLSKSENMKINRTDILFEIADKILKIGKFILKILINGDEDNVYTKKKKKENKEKYKA
jgi:hypothetical protein